MVINACKTADNGFDLPCLKQIGLSASTKPTIQDHRHEFQCQVSKVQTSLLPPWLAVDDGEWRPSGDLHLCADKRLIPCLERADCRAARSGHCLVMTHMGPMIFGGERDQSLCDPHLYLLDCGPELGTVTSTDTRRPPNSESQQPQLCRCRELTRDQKHPPTPNPPLPSTHYRSLPGKLRTGVGAFSCRLVCLRVRDPPQQCCSSCCSPRVRPPCLLADAAVPLPTLPRRQHLLGVAPGAPSSPPPRRAAALLRSFDVRAHRPARSERCF
jgi:hypothetical protein